MKKLKDLTLEEFVNLTSTDEPAPGGGSVAALVGSLGAALGEMVYNLSKGKKAYLALEDAVKDEVAEDFAILTGLRQELIALIDEDTKAFNAFMDALRMPKSTEAEIAARQAKMAECSVYSMQIPLKTAEKSLEILRHLGNLSLHGSKNCISDAGVGASCAYTAVESAIMNVRINLSGISDEAIVKDAEAKCQSYHDEAVKLLDKITTNVYKKI